MVKTKKTTAVKEEPVKEEVVATVPVVETPKEESDTVEFNIFEIIKTPEYLRQLQKQLNEIITKVASREAPVINGKAARYKRTWYDEFEKNGWMTAEVFTSQFELILLKECTLSSYYREVVSDMCISAIRNTLKLEANEKAPEISEPESTSDGSQG